MASYLALPSFASVDPLHSCGTFDAGIGMIAGQPAPENPTNLQAEIAVAQLNRFATTSSNDQMLHGYGV